MIAALLMAGCASAPTSLQSHTQKEQVQIARRLAEVLDAAQKKDLARLDSYHLYGPGFTKFSASPPGRQDATASRKGEHEGLNTISDLKMRADDLKIDVFGNVAIATFLLDSSFKAGGNAYQKLDQGTLVFVNDHGDWKITHEHFSPFKVNQ